MTIYETKSVTWLVSDFMICVHFRLCVYLLLTVAHSIILNTSLRIVELPLMHFACKLTFLIFPCHFGDVN